MEPRPPTPSDIAELRKQGDLKAAIKAHTREIRDRNAERRASVLRYPDLAKKLTEEPHCWTKPERWNGYIPPALWNQAPNKSPQRAALLALVAEAERRDAAGRRAAA